MEPNALTLGTKVLVTGLQGRADSNGRLGTVCGAFDDEAGRVPIKVALAKLARASLCASSPLICSPERRSPVSKLSARSARWETLVLAVAWAS